MKNLLPLITLLAMTMLAGCGIFGESPAVRFYRLSPVADAAIEAAPNHKQLPVRVEAVKLPDWLRRPQIVTEGQGGELMIDDYVRWGGRLDWMVGDALASNLSTYLGSKAVSAYPAEVRLSEGFRVFVAITDFVVTDTGMLRLEASWVVTGPDARTIIHQDLARYEQPVDGASDVALVAAHSRAIGMLAHDIALKLSTLMQ